MIVLRVETGEDTRSVCMDLAKEMTWTLPLRVHCYTLERAWFWQHYVIDGLLLDESVPFK